MPSSRAVPDSPQALLPGGAAAVHHDRPDVRRPAAGRGPARPARSRHRRRSARPPTARPSAAGSGWAAPLHQPRRAVADVPAVDGLDFAQHGAFGRRVGQDPADPRMAPAAVEKEPVDAVDRGVGGGGENDLQPVPSRITASTSWSSCAEPGRGDHAAGEIEREGGGPGGEQAGRGAAADDAAHRPLGAARATELGRRPQRRTACPRAAAFRGGPRRRSGAGPAGGARRMPWHHSYRIRRRRRHSGTHLAAPPGVRRRQSVQGHRSATRLGA